VIFVSLVLPVFLVSEKNQSLFCTAFRKMKFMNCEWCGLNCDWSERCGLNCDWSERCGLTVTGQNALRTNLTCNIRNGEIPQVT
jgi:hypothetical protein